MMLFYSVKNTFYQCAATQECHAADTGHGTPPRHSILTQGRPAVVLSIDVEHWNTQLPILMSNWVRPYCTQRVLNPGPVVCESITLSARPQLPLMSYIGLKQG